MLLQEIRVNESSDGKLDIEFCIMAAFRTHCDWYNEVMEVIDSAAELIVGSVDEETADVVFLSERAGRQETTISLAKIEL